MRPVVIRGLSGAKIFFSVISFTARFSLKKFIDHKAYVFIRQLLSAKLLIPKRTGRDMIKDLHWSSCKVRVILVRF
jgi:hypothetical protein